MSKDRQPTDKFRDQSKCFEIQGRYVLKQVVSVHKILFGFFAEAHRLGIQSAGDMTGNPVKSTATDKQDVFRVQGDHFLVGVLTSPLRWNIDYCTFQ